MLIFLVLKRLKLRYLFLILVLLCWLPGCKQELTEKRYTFLVLPRTLENDFHATLVAGAKASALENKITLQIHATAGEDDYVFQERHLNQVTSKEDIDGIIITPGHSTKLIAALRNIDKRGIPFIVVDTPLELSNEPPFEHYCGFIGTDNRRGGGLAADYIGKTIKSGNVLLIRGVVSHRTSQDRETGFLKTIEKYPGIRIAKFVEGRWNYSETKKAIEKLPQDTLSSIDAVFAYNDLMALGAAGVLRNHGLRPLIVGYDGILEAQSAIIAGEIDATVTQAPGVMGQRAVTKLRQCIEDHSYRMHTDLTHVTLLIATRTLTAVSSYENEKK